MGAWTENVWREGPGRRQAAKEPISSELILCHQVRTRGLAHLLARIQLNREGDMLGGRGIEPGHSIFSHVNFLASPSRIFSSKTEERHGMEDDDDPIGSHE